MMKRKSSKAGDKYVPKGYDLCQSPEYAVWPLLEYTPKDWIIWECAAGEGNLVHEMLNQDYSVLGSELLPEYTSSLVVTPYNFFEWEPPGGYDCIITNPPYSIKYSWIKRCYELEVPWALLLPVETLGAKTAQAMFDTYGMQLILMNTRIDFKMPNKGWEGTAQFPVAWFTHGFNLPSDIVYDQYTGGYKALDKLRRK